MEGPRGPPPGVEEERLPVREPVQDRCEVAVRVVDAPGQERVEVAAREVVELRKELGGELLGPEQLPEARVVDVPAYLVPG